MRHSPRLSSRSRLPAACSQPAFRQEQFCQQSWFRAATRNIITAVANASAQDVQHTIKVSQVASNAIWANAHVFDSKTDSINTSSSTQKFSFTYAGKRHDFDVPANTTLGIICQHGSTILPKTPGIKISIVKAGKGYVFHRWPARATPAKKATGS